MTYRASRQQFIASRIAGARWQIGHGQPSLRTSHLGLARPSSSLVEEGIEQHQDDAFEPHRRIQGLTTCFQVEMGYERRVCDALR